MNLSCRLKELRTEKGLTQKEVAKALDISTTCYAGYEQGYREPDLKTLKNISEFFNVTAGYVLGTEDDFGGFAQSNQPEEKNENKISPDEKQILKAYRALSPRDKELFLSIINNFKRPL